MDKTFAILINFSGSGSKLLQSQLSNSKDIFTIPAYPLIYLPYFYKKWTTENKFITSKKLLKLITKQHASLLDTRKIPGFNGLNKLGQEKKSFIKISKKKFNFFFLNYFKKEKINLNNLIKAVHFSYQYSIGDKCKKILYHPHDIDTFERYLSKKFLNSKKIILCRNPIFNFWRRVYAEKNIEKSRFDLTDQEVLKNYHYIYRLTDHYLQIKYLQKNYKNRGKFFIFEDLKLKNYETLRKICKFLKIRFNFRNMSIPKYGNKIWWGNSIYKGFSNKSNFKKKIDENKYDLNKFFKYEVLLLEIILKPFFNKFKFKKINPNKRNNLFFFLLFIFLPTKYGLKLFFSRLNPINIINFIKSNLDESFNKKIKNYYFNGMYKYKWCYRWNYLINFNIIRKKLFKNKNNYIYKIANFLIKIFIYFFCQVELIFLYFVRIYLMFYLLIYTKKKSKYISKYN